MHIPTSVAADSASRCTLQPLPKALSGLLRGGTTISDAVPELKQPVITVNTHDDIGAAGYDSIVFTASGTKQRFSRGAAELNAAGLASGDVF
jgi:hypothetical protein